MVVPGNIVSAILAPKFVFVERRLTTSVGFFPLKALPPLILHILKLLSGLLCGVRNDKPLLWYGNIETCDDTFTWWTYSTALRSEILFEITSHFQCRCCGMHRDDSCRSVLSFLYCNDEDCKSAWAQKCLHNSARIAACYTVEFNYRMTTSYDDVLQFLRENSYPNQESSNRPPSTV